MLDYCTHLKEKQKGHQDSAHMVHVFRQNVFSLGCSFKSFYLYYVLNVLTFVMCYMLT